ncbi:YfhO family protein [Vagococcus silagei]|uniref:Copper ABC transporter permease n=1 Tax=Vagococcus silagei TaxID=2508885 RepID=A0A4S3B394_9ENTE|nr:YfhO family protein [Vagococcus silagei]THB60898.1 copper ABC transporter permease [Vagococcus silagei]
MRQARRKTKKKIWGFGVAAFFIPVLIMFLVYLSLGIYWGSERSVLASDAFAQFSNFHASFNNVLHGEQSIFYTWNASLGLNFWSLISYYLGGIFTPLVFFFKNQNIPDALYLITLVKIGSAGLAFWFYAKETFKLNQWSILSLSVSYALMSFSIAQSEVIMWLDAMVYLPLIILGINRIFENKKPTLLFVAYFMLFVSNFYFGFMIGVFSFLYFIAKLFLNKKEAKKRVVPYFLTAFTAGISSMILILPSILDLKSNGETLTKLTMLKTEATSAWDIIAKNMIGSYDTTKYGSIPFIYIGLIPLVFCIFYFITKKISLNEKIAYGSIMAFIFLSFYLDPLNLFWHGMHAPNMFLFRFSFLFSFTVIMLAGYGWEKFEKEDSIYFIGTSIILIVLFVLAKLTTAPEHFDFISLESLALTILFMILYILLMSLYHQGKFLMKHLAVLLFFLMAGEAFLNTNFMLNGILDDWNYASRSLYSDPYKSIDSLVNRAEKENENNFYRLESLDDVSSNDTFNYGYSGISMFSSVRNRHSSGLLDTLGYRSQGTNLNIRYDNNTVMMDSLFGIRHNISKQPVNKFGYEVIESKGEYQLYQNSLALPLGMLTDKDLYNLKLPDTDNLGSQTMLMNQLSNLTTEYFDFIKPKLVKSENTKIIPKGDQKVLYQEKKPDIGKKLTFNVLVPAGQQAYISIFPTDFGLLDGSSAIVTSQGVTNRSQIDITGQYYNLGYFSQESTIQFTVEFTGSPEVEVIEPTVVTLDTNHYQTAIRNIQQKDVKFKVDKRHAYANVNLVEDQVLFTTIPYDKGWTARIDGKKVKTKPFEKGLLTFNVPKGKHDIELSYLPPGLNLGFACLFLGIATFSGYVLFFYNPQSKRKSSNTNSSSSRRRSK